MKTFFAPSVEHLQGASLPAYAINTFPDGERDYVMTESLKAENVTLVASVLPDPTSLFDLLALHRLLRDQRALKTWLVVPYFGYARLDRLTKNGEAAIGIMVAEHLKATKADITVLDPHSPKILRALGRQARELSAIPLLATEILKLGPVDVVVAPDKGASLRAERFADALGTNPRLATITKKRLGPGVVKAGRLEGDVNGAQCVVVDDMIDSGGTIEAAVNLLKKHGAASIRVAATHGIFSGNARDHLAALPIEKIVVTNSLPQTAHQKFVVIDVWPLLSNSLALDFRKKP